jgi:hypothetical protein
MYLPAAATNCLFGARRYLRRLSFCDLVCVCGVHRARVFEKMGVKSAVELANVLRNS